MTPAIYARRSADHKETPAPVQMEEARRYVESQGWLLDARRVYIADALSRLEHQKKDAP